MLRLLVIVCGIRCCTFFLANIGQKLCRVLALGVLPLAHSDTPPPPHGCEGIECEPGCRCATRSRRTSGVCLLEKSDLERWDARHRNEREPGSVLVYVTRLSEFRNEADRSLNHFFTRCGLAWWPPTTSHPPPECQTLPRKHPHAAACRLPAICQASERRAS